MLGKDHLFVIGEIAIDHLLDQMNCKDISGPIQVRKDLLVMSVVNDLLVLTIYLNTCKRIRKIKK